MKRQIKNKRLLLFFVERGRWWLLSIIMVFLMVTCGNNRRPGLSDKELFAERQIDTPQQASEQMPDFSEIETYIVPQGIKYNESRAVDPANPPVVLDIANRNLNIKKFSLSDYYSQVRYVKIKDPKLVSKENPRFELFGPQFIFTGDFIIAGGIRFGIHCYDKDGKLINVIEANNDIVQLRGTGGSYNPRELIGYDGSLITATGNYIQYNIVEDSKFTLCLYDLTRQEKIMSRPSTGSFNRESANMIIDNGLMASYVYEPVRTPEDFLFTFDLKGDTLCRFPNYNPPVQGIGGSAYPAPLPPDIYYHGGRLTVCQSFNDTVYRVIPPNRLVPAYIMNFGSYKTDEQTYFRGNLSEKLLPERWMETDQYILFFYTQDRNHQINRTNGIVKFFYSYYDKKSRQYYHFGEGNNIPDDAFYMENPIPDALPFMLSYTDMADNQLRVFYTKTRLVTISKTKEFASLPAEQQNQLKTIQNELDDNEVLIMILE